MRAGEARCAGAWQHAGTHASVVCLSSLQFLVCIGGSGEPRVLNQMKDEAFIFAGAVGSLVILAVIVYFLMKICEKDAERSQFMKVGKYVPGSKMIGVCGSGVYHQNLYTY
jgi:hypothetical protein